MPTDITQNLILNVPADYPTIHEAVGSLKNSWINNDVAVTIKVSGRHTYTEPVKLRHPHGNCIRITGEDTIAKAATSVSVTGSPGNWVVTWNVDTTGVTVGDIIRVEGTAGGAKHAFHRGAHEVIEIVSPIQLRVKNTNYETGAPSVVTATMRVFPTQLVFVDCNALDGGMLGGCEKLAAKWVHEAPGAAPPIHSFALARDRFNAAPSYMVLGPQVAISGFSADGVRPNAGGGVTATDVTVSNSGNNGFNNRDGGVLSLYDYLSTGNGWGGFAAAGGANGVMTQCSSATYVAGGQSIGNAGNGIYSRTQSSFLIENGSPVYTLGGKYALATYAGGFAQANGIIVEFPQIAAFYASNNSTVLRGGSLGVTTSHVSNSSFLV